MNKISIARSKWIEVYNSILLLRFFVDQYQQHPDGIEEVNRRFATYCTQNGLIGNNHRFEGGTNTVAFCYLIIVRVIEILKVSGSDDKGAREELFRSVLKQIDSDGYSSFDQLVQRHQVVLHTFSFCNEPDEVKLYELFRHVRHSISHMAYEIDLRGSLRLKSLNPRTRALMLDMEMEVAQLINLSARFGGWVNNALHADAYLT
ncbi:MAG: hypothetical protein IPP22_02435 [Nitrosomonas sp.]|nr:hypothetical protein [Nitrosomonas sp.]